MIPRVVLDTNILVSAMLSENSKPAKVVHLALDGEITAYYNDEIWAEYVDVLFRPCFHFMPEKVRTVLNTLQEKALFVQPETSTLVMLDETDRRFYDTAKSVQAILITGNGRHFPKETFIMTPHEFLSRFMPI